MGVLDNFIEEVKVTKPFFKPKKTDVPAGISSGTPDEILTDDDEIERLSKYISPKHSRKIINVNTGIKHGVEKIGTLGDSNNVLRSLLSGASKKSKTYAAKVLVNKWARENLTQVILSKSGKELFGKSVSKNIYIKKVSYMRAGKIISYLQARNKLTGRVVSYKTATKLLARLR